jgi:murein DD-endopeptidase MepM/ murein hydrolase activator NlpD
MELIDLTKQKMNELLPRKHQIVLANLFSGLLLLLVMTTAYETANRTSDSDTTSSRSSDVSAHLTSFDPNHPDISRTNPDAIGLLSDIHGAEMDPRLFLEVGAGDNLTALFNRAGLGAKDVQAIADSSPEKEILAELYPGDRLALEIAQDETLRSLEIIKSPLKSYLFTLGGQGKYAYTLVEKEPTLAPVYKEAVINDSLFLAAQRGNIPAALAMELAGIFGGVVDFILDTREGDTFNVIYEEKFLDGEYIGYGRILAAQFTNQGETHTAVRYENSQGEVNFFNLEGESMRKAFLRNPVDFTRISSGFNPSRRHPILNTIRAHKGTDYAAPTGTPVVATADGRVIFANRKGSYGKLVVIQHGDRFETRYAHLNDYAKGIKNGTRVRQGDPIGYVGSTGGATGPHLHYEFLMDGVQRNSRTIHDQLPKAESVAAAEMPRFKQQTGIFLSLLESKGKANATLAQYSLTSPQE